MEKIGVEKIYDRKETVPEKVFTILVDKIILRCLAEKIDYRHGSDGEIVIGMQLYDIYTTSTKNLLLHTCPLW